MRVRLRGQLHVLLNMAELALILYVVYLALAFGLRTVIQLRRTGSTGFHGIGGKPGSAEWLAGVGFVLALVFGASAPVLALPWETRGASALTRTSDRI